MTRDAFNDIIHKHNRKFFAIAFRMLQNQQEAEDVVQEVFMKMWMMENSLDGYNDICALGVTITRNKCLDMLRKRKKLISDSDEATASESDTSPSPFDKIVLAEDESIIHRIIEDLPPLYREVIQLREIIGLSYKEIAEMNDVTINSLRVTISRARQMVKEKYLKWNDYRRQVKGTSR